MSKKWTWEHIVDLLIREFQENVYKKGDKMPSENKMAVRFAVTRSEIRRAYERLKELGYIYSMQGYGSFFSGKREKIRLSMTDESFSAKMTALNLPYETQNVGCQLLRGDSLLHAMLGLDFEEPVYKVTRLRILDNEPAAIHISYLPQCCFPHIAKEGGAITSVYEYINQCGYTGLRTENSQLTVSSLSKKERNLLQIKGYAPSLVLTCRCVTLPSKKIVEVARTIYRSDKFIFEI